MRPATPWARPRASARDGGGALGGAPRAMLGRCADERAEQRVRPCGPRSKLGVELPGDEERVVRQFDDLGEPALLGRATDHHPARLQRLVVGRVDLPTVAVSLLDDVDTVRGRRTGAWLDVAGLRAQSHART